MTTLTTAQQFRILQSVSGHFLTDEYPDEWLSMGEEEQLEYIEECVWAPMEDTPITEVMSIIEDATTCTIKLFNEILGGGV